MMKNVCWRSLMKKKFALETATASNVRLENTKLKIAQSLIRANAQNVTLESSSQRYRFLFDNFSKNILCTENLFSAFVF